MKRGPENGLSHGSPFEGGGGGWELSDPHPPQLNVFPALAEGALFDSFLSNTVKTLERLRWKVVGSAHACVCLSSLSTGVTPRVRPLDFGWLEPVEQLS